MEIRIDGENVWIQILKKWEGFFLTKTEEFGFTSFKIICFLAQAIVLYSTGEAG